MAPASTNLLVQPFVLMIGAGVLIWLLGYSAIVGIGVRGSLSWSVSCSSCSCWLSRQVQLVSTSFSVHVQELRIVLIYSAKMFTLLLRNRQAQTKLIDKRVGLMAEILNNLRAVKLYAYEKSMSQKVSAVREEEMAILRTYGGLRSTLNSLFGFIPVLAAVCRSCVNSICHC